MWWRVDNSDGHAGSGIVSDEDTAVHQSWHPQLLRKDYTYRSNLSCLG